MHKSIEQLQDSSTILSLLMVIDLNHSTTSLLKLLLKEIVNTLSIAAASVLAKTCRDAYMARNS